MIPTYLIQIAQIQTGKRHVLQRRGRRLQPGHRPRRRVAADVLPGEDGGDGEGDEDDDEPEGEAPDLVVRGVDDGQVLPAVEGGRPAVGLEAVESGIRVL